VSGQVIAVTVQLVLGRGTDSYNIMH
jgi:hypothetical protein